MAMNSQRIPIGLRGLVVSKVRVVSRSGIFGGRVRG